LAASPSISSNADWELLSYDQGAVNGDELIAGQPQTRASHPDRKFELFRIGDAVGARNAL
jgi:hypothetical protein